MKVWQSKLIRELHCSPCKQTQHSYSTTAYKLYPVYYLNDADMYMGPINKYNIPIYHVQLCIWVKKVQLVQACLRAPPVVADEAKLAIVFSPTFFFFFLFLFLSSFFSAFYFSPTSGNLPCVEICFPQYFGITRRYMQKKKYFF